VWQQWEMPFSVRLSNGAHFLFCVSILIFWIYGGVEMNESSDNTIQMMTLQNDFQLEPVKQEVNFDRGFTKISLTNNQKKQISAALQHMPTAVASSTMANAYILRFPDGIDNTLMSLKQGGVSSTWLDASGHIGGTASLYSMNIEAAMLGAFSAMAIASSQYFIKQINSELQMINQSMDKILEFLYGDKKAELLSEVSFIKYAYENYSSIMGHNEQRVATIASLQDAKKVAMKDIEFYMCDLDSTINSKSSIDELVTNAFQIKESLELSIQLYGMSSVLETYFSQNYDVEFIKYVEQEITSYIDKCEKRILSSFSALKKFLNDYKGRLLKKEDKSQYENLVGELVDSLYNGEESAIRKSLRKTLQETLSAREYYVKENGEVYLKEA
jgi:hypothetical protein